MLAILGVNFGGDFVCLGGGLKPWRNTAEKLMCKIRKRFWAILLKFARPQ